MKKLTSLISIIILPMILNAQWIQTSLNQGGGYCLYSNKTTVYAGTETGVAYTQDIGDPWFNIGPQDGIFSVIEADGNIVAGSGTGKGIWISSDMGNNWKSASGVNNQSIFTLCKHGIYLFAGAWGGGVFRSEDNGNSWQKIGLDGEPVEALLSTETTIFTGGMSPSTGGARVFFSTDLGENWGFSDLPYPASRIHCFAFKDNKIFAGTDGGLYSSDNSGISWTLEYGVIFDNSGNVIDAKMFKALLAYDNYLIASILFNSLWISQDNGKEWSSFSEGLISDWSFSGLAIKDTCFWSLRNAFGNAYRKLNTDLVTNVHTEDVTLIKKFVLNQSYPNPFNSSTEILFSLPYDDEISLMIYNMQGQLVKRLSSGQFKSGEYGIIWNSTNDYGIQTPSGIYFAVLKSSNYIAKSKLILTK